MVPLTASSVRLGRLPAKCDVVVTSSGKIVSGLHAVLRRTGDGQWSLTDCSSNGTFVNGKRLEKGNASTLAPSDQISLGPVANTESVIYEFKTHQSAHQAVKANPVVASPALRRRGPFRPQDPAPATIQLCPESTSVKLGRIPGKCDVVVSSSNLVSGLHAVLRCTGDGQWSLTDYSSNGTFVNGKRLEKGNASTLSPNDQISLGGKSSENSGKSDIVQYVFVE